MCDNTDYNTAGISDTVVIKNPTPEVYELETTLLPWGMQLSLCVEKAAQLLPENARVVDYMCGTGLLLSQLKSKRPDVQCVGVDISEEYISYGKACYENIELLRDDALLYQPEELFDAVICTAGLHHLHYEHQIKFLSKIRNDIKTDGYLFLSEIVLTDDKTEVSRRLSTLELGHAFLVEAVNCRCSDDVMRACFWVQENDLFLQGEYKRAHKTLLEIIGKHFVIENQQRTWPEHSASFGDMLFLCRLRN